LSGQPTNKPAPGIGMMKSSHAIASVIHVAVMGALRCCVVSLTADIRLPPVQACTCRFFMKLADTTVPASLCRDIALHDSRDCPGFYLTGLRIGAGARPSGPPDPGAPTRAPPAWAAPSLAKHRRLGRTT